MHWSSRNRLQKPTDLNTMQTAFSALTEIQLNGTMMTWTEMQEVTANMPKLRFVEMGYNRLERLQTSALTVSLDSAIEVFNLDSNLCSEWDHVYNSLLQYPSCVFYLPFWKWTRRIFSQVWNVLF